jgi:hypothetical protein
MRASALNQRRVHAQGVAQAAAGHREVEKNPSPGWRRLTLQGRFTRISLVGAVGIEFAVLLRKSHIVTALTALVKTNWCQLVPSFSSLARQGVYIRKSTSKPFRIPSFPDNLVRASRTSAPPQFKIDFIVWELVIREDRK